MKQVLIDTIPFSITPQQLHEGLKASSGNPLVEGILATAEVKNGNGRYYPKDIWEREIDKYQQTVKENRATGELDHPDSTIINLKNQNNLLICFVVNNITGGLSIDYVCDCGILNGVNKHNKTVFLF